jgi:membrane protein DedA with SNARE-associated domain
MRTRVILVTARCFLAVSMYLIVILVVLLNGAFMARLVGTKATTYMNPITGQVLSFSIFIMIAYILASWIWYIFSRFSHRQSLQKGKQGNADRQSMKNKNKSTAKPQKQKVFR